MVVRGINMVMFLLGGLSVFIVQAIGIGMVSFVVLRDDRTLAARDQTGSPIFHPRKSPRQQELSYLDTR